MRPLPEAARAIVESARDAHDPSDAQVQNMLTKLHAQLGYAPVPSEPAPTPPPVAGSIEGARGLLHAKLLKLALSIAAIGGMTALVMPQLWKTDAARPSSAAVVAPATPEQPSAPSADALQPSAPSPEVAQDEGAQNAASGNALWQEDDAPEQAPRATARTGAVAQRSAASSRTARVNLSARETSRTGAGTARGARRSASSEASGVGVVAATERGARRSASSVAAVDATERGARRSASSEASGVAAVDAAERGASSEASSVGVVAATERGARHSASNVAAVDATERGASSEALSVGAVGAAERGASSDTARGASERGASSDRARGASERGASSNTARVGSASAAERGASSETADVGAERNRSDDAVRTLAALDSGRASAAPAAAEKVLLSDDVVPVQTARKRVEEKARSASDADELALIDRAASLLRDGEPERALGLLQEHGRKFPASQLTLERRGLSVLARCSAGQIEQARRERDEFLRDAGKAPIAARVRRACPEPQR